MHVRRLLVKAPDPNLNINMKKKQSCCGGASYFIMAVFWYLDAGLLGLQVHSESGHHWKAVAVVPEIL